MLNSRTQKIATATVNLLQHLLCMLIFSAILTSPAQASVKIGGTRIVYNSGDKESSIQLSNINLETTLIQSWISLEDDTHTSQIPFALTPSLLLLKPGETHTLRIFYEGKGLPMDKESYFILNVLEIPSKSATNNTVQFAIRQRIKVLFRPKQLYASAAEAAQRTTWHISKENIIKLHNPSAIHLSLIDICIAQAKQCKKIKDSVFIRPGETKILRAADLSGATSATINFTEINDYGLQIKHETKTD